MEEKLAKFRQNRQKQQNGSVLKGTSIEDAISPLKKLFSTNVSSDVAEGISTTTIVGGDEPKKKKEQASSQKRSGADNSYVTVKAQSPTTIWILRSLKLLTWFLIAYILSCYELAGPFILVSAASALLYYGTSSRARKKTELSAYSVFNPNCVRIEGTLTAEQFENEILRRPLDSSKKS